MIFVLESWIVELSELTVLGPIESKRGKRLIASPDLYRPAYGRHS